MKSIASAFRTGLQVVSLCEKPIFIIGSPRSGTSILAWSLHAHSRLWTSGECDVLFNLFQGGQLDREYDRLRAPMRGWFRREGVEREEFMQALGLGIHALYSSRSEGQRWVDQTPSNTLVAEALASMFPDALFLHILRDGRQVVNSMLHFRHLLDLDESEEDSGFSFVPTWVNNFRHACETWSRHTEAALAFAQHHPDRCVTVDYTELTAEPEREFSRILAFLGMPHEDGPAQFLRSKRINSSFSPGVVASSSHAWDDWTQEQRQVFLEKAGETLLRCHLVLEEELRSLKVQAGFLPDDNRHTSQILGDEVRHAVRSVAPSGSIVLVTSKGEDELIRLDGSEGWHFPRTRDGLYAGYHPASSEEAIGHLELMRSAGAQFLVVPHTAFWWFQYYPDFAAHLRRRYALAMQQSALVLFDLREARAPVATVHGAQPVEGSA